MKRERLRFALVGAGGFGPEFARYVDEVAEIVAICDPNPASHAHFRAFTDLDVPAYLHHEQLFDQVGLDAIAITSPNFTHKPLTVAAAQRGLHVYCEKAMALNVPECWEMAAACEANGVRLMVGQKRRLRPPWARMIEVCQQLGGVISITAVEYWNIRQYDHPAWWKRDELVGGTLCMSGVHVIDWMRAACGDVACVSAVAAPQIDSSITYPDTLHVTLQFRSGAVASLNVSLQYPLLHFRQSAGPQVVCRDGGLRLLPDFNHIDLYWQRMSETKANHERFDDLGFDHAFRREIGDFVRWITDSVEPCLTWREGLRCIEVIEAAHRSAQHDGSWQGLPLYPELEMA